jgi:hypothetical protein
MIKRDMKTFFSLSFLICERDDDAQVYSGRFQTNLATIEKFKNKQEVNKMLVKYL